MPSAPPRPRSIIDFSPFQLDLTAGLLRRGPAPLALRPKTFEVLRYLAEHPGELVTKDALLDAVWRGVAVTEDVVRVCVGELRAALGDQRAAPRFIETVPRRGYRFIATLAGAEHVRSDPARVATYAAPQPEGTMVGRVHERRIIAEWIDAARSGRRQVGFISGEAGMGKTTLVDVALRDLRSSPGTEWRIALGQCIEQYGGGEPYLPVLDALAALCRFDHGELVRSSLGAHAPDWLMRMLGAAPREGGHGPAAAGTHEHTLHQLASSLDALAAETPLIVVLEDVHWSDYATLDLLSLLAQRREPANLLVLCTLRPADAIVRDHPVTGVKRELLRKGLGHEILLDGLPAADVASYLAARLDTDDLPEDLLYLFVDRTEGNPFFIVTLVDHLLERGLLVRSDQRWEIRATADSLRAAIPEGLRAVVEPRLDRLKLEELRVLEAASVVGPEFAAHAVARMAPGDDDSGDVENVEQLCDGLARRQEILRRSGESTWPDGTTSTRYVFRHALYQQVLYQRIPSSSCRRLHQTIGESLAAAYGERTMDVASELAAHFERSRDTERAIRYRQEAAAHARSRLAYQETRLHLQTALDLLASLPESADNLRRRMTLSNELGWTLLAVNSWGNDDTLRAFSEMRELAERLDDPSMRIGAMQALRSVHTVRAEYAASQALCEETIALAEGLGDEMAAGTARTDLASCLLQTGEFASALDHAERGRALFDDATVHGMSNRLLLASSCAQLGQVSRSRAMGLEAVAGAEKLGDPFFRAWVRTFAAANRQLLLDVDATRALAEEGARLAAEGGFSALRGVGSIVLGWCAIQQGRTEEGRAAVQAGFLEHHASGQRISMSSFHAILADAHLACGDVAAANQMLDAGVEFAAETGERFAEHELLRLRGECLLAKAPTGSQKVRASEYFERAIAFAREKKALLYELRAATSLLRLWGESSGELAAHLVERFGPEDDCADVRSTRSLLARSAR